MDNKRNNDTNETDDLIKAIAGDNLSQIALDPSSIILVAGVGGAGGNAVNHMYDMGITGVNFVVCNTDQRAMDNSPVECKIRLGRDGLGAGNDAAKGRDAALESEPVLRSLLETSSAKMIFIAAGMGGGTGTGASPVIAKMAHEMGLLTVAVVTLPLRMEGEKRYNQALEGITELHKWVDSLLIIDNEKLSDMYGKLPIREAFGKADDVLGMATKGIAELITVEYSLVRVDFSDLEKVMRGSGRAHMAVVSASGENRSEEVATGSLASPLLDNNLISGAKNILLSFSVADIDTLLQEEVTHVLKYIQRNASYTDIDGRVHTANIIWGASEKRTLDDGMLELVIVATGFDDGCDLQIERKFDVDDADNGFGISLDEPKIDIEPETERDNDELIPPARPSAQPQGQQIVPEQRIPVLGARTDRYTSIDLEKREPAYRRRKMQFLAESESSRKTVFRLDRTGEKPSSEESLFGNDQQ